LERVRSKWFVVMTILSPLLMVGMIMIPALLGSQGSEGARVVIVDRSKDDLGKSMSMQLALHGKWNTSVAEPGADEKALRRRIENNEINGYVVIPPDALDGGEIQYNGDNASNESV